ncbi:MAG: ATP-binding protein, partial [Frankia sp.]
EDLANRGRRFWRGGSDVNVGGSGLGLSIAAALLAASDGSISFGLGEPAGLVVTLRVPLRSTTGGASRGVGLTRARAHPVDPASAPDAASEIPTSGQAAPDSAASDGAASDGGAALDEAPAGDLRFSSTKPGLDHLPDSGIPDNVNNLI